MSGESIGANRQRVKTNLALLLFAVFLLHYIRRLVAEPTFFDGQFYASIARNMAEGVGSMWRPQFSATLFPLFAEHPPLAFWLEAPLYRLFGEGIWIEKLYSLLMLLLSAALLAGIWRRVTAAVPGLRDAVAIPLLLSLLAGRLAWGFANNMLENTLIVFTSLAIWLVTVAYDGNRSTAVRLGLIAAAGLSTALALMTKGPVGLFPVAVCGIHWLVFRRPGFWVALIDGLLMVAVVAAFFLILWAIPEPHAYIQRYLDQQLLASLSGARGQPDDVFSGLGSLLRLNAYPFVLAVVIVLSARIWPRRQPVVGEPSSQAWRPGLFFLLTAVSASLPLLVSPRLHSFYFNPSLAYYAAALAVWCAPFALQLASRLDALAPKGLRAGLIVLLVAATAVTVANIGNRGRDREMIEATHRIAAQVCASGQTCRAVIATCHSLWEDWQLQTYLQRYHHISLADLGAGPADLDFLVTDASCDPTLSKGLQGIDLGLPTYQFFHR